MGSSERMQRYTKFIVYVVAVVLINLAGITLFFRADLTAHNKFSLSGASKDTLAEVAAPLTIKVFFTENLPAPYNATERYLHDLLEEYALYADKNFNYQFYNVTPREGDMSAAIAGNQELAKDYGIYPVQVQNIEADEVKFQKAYMGMVIVYGDMTETIDPIRSTDGMEYQITTAIGKLSRKISTFMNLQDPVTIRLYLSSALYRVAPFLGIDTMAQLPKTISEIIDDMNTRLAGKLVFEAIDPTQTPDQVPAIEGTNLIRLEWPAINQKAGAQIPAGDGIIGLSMHYGDEQISLPLLNVVEVPIFGTQYSMPDKDTIEASIDKNMERLVGINDDIGYVTSNGTLDISAMNMFNPQRTSPDESISNFRKAVAKNYTINQVNLESADLAEGFPCLIIARPTEPFTDYELFQIDQYLMRGNSLALFLDQFKAVYPEGRQSPYAQPMFQPVSTGLENLLKHYGLEIPDTVVMDENCFKQRRNSQMGGGEQPIYFAPLIKNRFVNNEPDFMNNIKGLIAMKMSPVTLQSDTLEQNGITATTLFSSSEKSWQKSGRITFNPMFIQPPGPGEKRESYPLACLLEGEFPSYFADKEIPVKESRDKTDEEVVQPDNDTPEIAATGTMIKKGNPGRIFVMGSSHMLRDYLFDGDSQSPNAVFVMNLIDKLNNREKVALLRSKQQTYNPLYEVSGISRTVIKWFNIIGLPVLIVLAGLIVWMLRAAKKKRIRMMFAG
ncbi:MAG: Gldg family protein [Thermodesulfobacteriota bacterium]|nr:Gldg family protein [Thermodesulfobacteriota bacterium]